MLFTYTALDNEGNEQEGSIEALNEDIAITSLQRRGLVVTSIESGEKKSIFQMRIGFLERVKNKEVVVLSRQIATLFEAQVSALKVFQLLGEQVENPKLKDALSNITRDLQSGSSIAEAFSKHDDIFSNFYVNMVRAGEESGKLDETFMYLADYLDRNYELTSKAKSALIYPAFVITVFIAVMALMLTTVIPNIATILKDSGQEVPIYTKIVIGISDFLVSYGIFLLVALVIGGFFAYRYKQTEDGEHYFSQIKLALPFFGQLYRKLYLSRLADNMDTMLHSGIPMVRAVEITASVVDNKVYEELLLGAVEDIKGGKSVSQALSDTEEIPGIMIQMMKVGEETGELGNILKTLSKYYRREVKNQIDTMIDLIEPAMIVLLGLGVGFLLASVLIPIYNVSTGI